MSRAAGAAGEQRGQRARAVPSSAVPDSVTYDRCLHKCLTVWAGERCTGSGRRSTLAAGMQVEEVSRMTGEGSSRCRHAEARRRLAGLG
jgi:hypothetical protein